MNAELALISRAARQIREEAQAATPGPWEPFGMAGIAAMDWEIVDERRIECGDCEAPVALTGCATRADAQHIAHFGSPAVALAVADWLDGEVQRIPQPGHPMADGTPVWISGPSQYALAVARAYLNTKETP